MYPSVMCVQRAVDGPKPVRRPREPWVHGGVLAAVVLAGAADLALTLFFMSTDGLNEANPIARWIAGFGPAPLAGFKCATLALAVGLLWRARHRCSARIAAWLCLAMLLAVGERWRQYTDLFSRFDAAADRTSPCYVVFS